MIPAGPVLRRLEVEDFGLIARATLEFADGLTVCSGETGSGKTMLIGALGFVLGERTSPDNVRTGAARARVTLEADVDAALRARLCDAGFELEVGEPAIFNRELQHGGRSSARINGRPATASQLREFGESVADFVGQHEQQRLLAPAYQLELLDRFAGSPALELRDAVAAAHRLAVALERELTDLEAAERRGLAEIEFARFALDEIDAAKLERAQDDRLRERRDYLANAERIAAALAQARAALAGSEGSAVAALGAAAASLRFVARFGAELNDLAESLAALQSDANDAAFALARALEATEFDARELESLGERLDLIERLKRKYGGTIEVVLESRDRFATTVQRYAGRDARRAELQSALETGRAQLERLAAELSEKRTAAARKLERAVAAELRELAMPSARFEVALERAQTIGPLGRERAEFALSPNPGEPMRPLARTASGGELSRVLLALVVVLAERRERTALVFDEIDAGVAGATANAVAQRLGDLARVGQILCVTHLAQIASWAERHYALVKRETPGATTIGVVELRERKAVLEELARMLSGTIKGVAVEHAETLLRNAQRRKATRRLSA